MSVMQTDQWLEVDFHSPEKICENFLEEFNETEPGRIYHYLRSFGMYQPSRASYRVYQAMKKQDLWSKTQKFYEQYTKMWNGPRVKIYLFPLESASRLLSRETKGNKAGVSFPDRMFLFLSDTLDDQELEALFVHEYHHVCRMKKQRKPIKKYTLLDSMILEGLAEWEVKRCCGEKYLAPWCSMYSEEKLQTYWDSYLKEHVSISKEDPLHDELLFGQGKYPSLLGYAYGYYLVDKLLMDRKIAKQLSLTIKSERFLRNILS